MAVLKVKNGSDWLPVDCGDTYGIKGDMFAWANIKGSGGVNDSSGLSSVMQPGTSTGSYVANFAVPQPDMNYGTHVTPGDKEGVNSLCSAARYTQGRSDENSVNIYMSVYPSTGRNVDPVSVSLFRYTGE